MGTATKLSETEKWLFKTFKGPEIIYEKGEGDNLCVIKIFNHQYHKQPTPTRKVNMKFLNQQNKNSQQQKYLIVILQKQGWLIALDWFNNSLMWIIGWKYQRKTRTAIFNFFDLTSFQVFQWYFQPIDSPKQNSLGFEKYFWQVFLLRVLLFLVCVCLGEWS